MTDRDRQGRYRSYTGHITLTEQDETGQHRGGSRKSGESQRGRVRKQSRACFSGDDCMGVGVFRFFSHLIFGPFVQGFSIQVSNCGGCVTNLHLALTRPVWCACILCRWCVLTSTLGSVFSGAQLIRWHFQREACSLFLQGAAVWPRSLGPCTPCDVGPKRV